MDPQACWRRFCYAMEDNDLTDAQYALEDLAEWLEKGGVAPVYNLYSADLRRLADILDSYVTAQETRDCGG